MPLSLNFSVINPSAFQRAVLCAVLCCAVALPRAQAQQPIKAPVEVTVHPKTALPQSGVTISGTSVVLGDHNQVTLRVFPPSGIAPDIKITMDAAGHYTTAYKPAGVGKYRVVVTGADGKGSAETAFTVAAPGAAATEDSAASHALIQAAIKAQDVVEQQLLALPPSPAKDELEKKLAQLKRFLGQLPAVQQRFDDALGKISEIGTANTELLPELQTLYDELDADRQDIEAKDQQLNKALEEAKAKNVTCDNLELANEVLTLISEGLDLIGKPWQKVLNIAVDKGTGKGIDAIAAKSTSETTKFAAGELIKVSIGLQTAGPDAANPMAWLTTAFGVAVDTAQYCAQKAFGKYCEKFEGPLNAQFRAEMRHRGEPWFTYKISMRGKLQLRYAKDDNLKPGEPIPLTGQIEGTAEAFEMAENAILIAPQLRSKVMRHFIVPLPGVSYVESAGTFARMTLPQSFYIPVRGALEGEKITLSIKEADKDFPDLIQGRVLYIFVEPALPIPVLQQFYHPIQKAYFIFTRGMMSSPQFDVKTDGAKSSIQRTFTRTVEDDTADFKLEWKIDMSACDPGCLP